MNKRPTLALVLIGLGSLNVLVGAGLHWAGGYPLVSKALAGSNLSAPLANAMRAVFLMIGLTWVTIAIIAFIAAFYQTRIRKLLVLLCGLSLLAEVPIWVALMGWFIGNEMFLFSGILISLGAILLPPSSNL